MAERLAEVAGKIQNVRQLEAVVTAMRGVAASRAQRGRMLLPAIGVISRAIGEALTIQPPQAWPASSDHRKRLGLVLFTAEQGFAGAFSEHVLDAVAEDRDHAVAFIVGTRGAVIAQERGQPPAWSAPMATHVDAIPSLANRIADALYDRIAAGALTHIALVVPRSTAGAGVSVERRSLLPLDLSRFPQPVRTSPPLTTLAPRVLLEQLTAEYVFAQLCDAAMEAYEAENQSRMMTMTAAKANIGGKLDALSQRERQLRQEEITSEIIELAGGAEALRRKNEL
jgi:F-type H+-transporting ATPase subunit gamma